MASVARQYGEPMFSRERAIGQQVDVIHARPFCSEERQKQDFQDFGIIRIGMVP
ncbi:MAG: hypothetical protein OXF79_13375 [Chloroflexi bacterium]|nr:hypothetical protein [Chloroflexota bacterium]